MGIVNEHCVVRRYRHHLNAALHSLGIGQRGGNLTQRQTQGQATGNDAQGVVDGKAAGNRQADPGNGVHGHCLKLHPVGEKPQILGGEIGLIPALRVSKRRTGYALGVIPSGLIVQVKYRCTTLVKQQALGLPVGLHGFVEVQMILSQIGEDTSPKGDAVQTMKHQGVGGGLHHHMAASGIRHFPQQLLYLPGLRGGAVGRQSLLADHILVGTDEADFRPQHPLQHGFQQIGGGGLAVGTGDSQHR